MNKVLKHGLRWMMWATIGAVVCAAALHGKHPDSTQIAVAVEGSVLVYPIMLFAEWLVNKMPLPLERK